MVETVVMFLNDAINDRPVVGAWDALPLAMWVASGLIGLIALAAVAARARHRVARGH